MFISKPNEVYKAVSESVIQSCQSVSQSVSHLGWKTVSCLSLSHSFYLSICQSLLCFVVALKQCSLDVDIYLLTSITDHDDSMILADSVNHFGIFFK